MSSTGSRDGGVAPAVAAPEVDASVDTDGAAAPGGGGGECGPGSANSPGDAECKESDAPLVLALHPLHRVKCVYFVRHGQASHNVDFERRGEAAYLSWDHEDSRWASWLDVLARCVGTALLLCFVATGLCGCPNWRRLGSRRLTPTGIQQATAAGKRILADGVHFDRVFVSSLTRALQVG